MSDEAKTIEAPVKEEIVFCGAIIQPLFGILSGGVVRNIGPMLDNAGNPIADKLHDLNPTQWAAYAVQVKQAIGTQQAKLDASKQPDPHPIDPASVQPSPELAAVASERLRQNGHRGKRNRRL